MSSAKVEIHNEVKAKAESDWILAFQYISMMTALLRTDIGSYGADRTIRCRRREDKQESRPFPLL